MLQGFGEFAIYADAVVHGAGLARLDVYGPIGQSCDHEQRLLKLSEPGKADQFSLGDLSGIIEVQP